MQFQYFHALGLTMIVRSCLAGRYNVVTAAGAVYYRNCYSPRLTLETLGVPINVAICIGKFYLLPGISARLTLPGP